WQEASSDINLITGNSQVYWTEADRNAQFGIQFGDGYIGKALSNGNIVIISYLASDGEAANFANSFTPINAIGGFSNVFVTANTAAAGGASPEDIDTTRFRAPLYNTYQNRSVTVNDYNINLQKNYPNIQSI